MANKKETPRTVEIVKAELESKKVELDDANTRIDDLSVLYADSEDESDAEIVNEASVKAADIDSDVQVLALELAELEQFHRMEVRYELSGFVLKNKLDNNAISELLDSVVNAESKAITDAESDESIVALDEELDALTNKRNEAVAGIVKSTMDNMVSPVEGVSIEDFVSELPAATGVEVSAKRKSSKRKSGGKGNGDIHMPDTLQDLAEKVAGGRIKYMVETGDVENVPKCSPEMMKRTAGWANTYGLGEIVDGKFVATAEGRNFVGMVK